MPGDRNIDDAIELLEQALKDVNDAAESANWSWYQGEAVTATEVEKVTWLVQAIELAVGNIPSLLASEEG